MARWEIFFWYSSINLVTAGERKLLSLLTAVAIFHTLCVFLASGYGDLVPGTRAAYLVSTVEQCTGIMLSALLLGIVVSRGAWPRWNICWLLYHFL